MNALCSKFFEIVTVLSFLGSSNDIGGPQKLSGSSSSGRNVTKSSNISSLKPWTKLMPEGSHLGPEWEGVRPVLLHAQGIDTALGSPLPYVITIRRYLGNAPENFWEFQVRYAQLSEQNLPVSESIIEAGKFKSIRAVSPLRIESPGGRKNKPEDKLGIFQVTHILSDADMMVLKEESLNFASMSFLLNCNKRQLTPVSFEFHLFVEKFMQNSDSVPREVEKVAWPFYWRKYGKK